jgi:outer membrane protein insertion porin family
MLGAAWRAMLGAGCLALGSLLAGSVLTGCSLSPCGGGSCGAGCATCGANPYGAGAPAANPWQPRGMSGEQVPTIQVPSAVPSGGQLPTQPNQPIIRGQSPGYGAAPSYNTAPGGYSAQATPGSDQYFRQPTPVSGGTPPATTAYSFQQPGEIAPGQNVPGQGIPGQGFAAPPMTTPLPPPPGGGLAPQGGALPPPTFAPTMPWWSPPSNVPLAADQIEATPAPVDIFVEETRTGRFMFGVAVNSDAGLTGQVTIDERNFDITRVPTSWDDFADGRAWRGAGQGFRIEAQPGSQVQRYLVSFTNPYFLDTDFSFSASGFYFDRRYFDWTESRYGGRLAWGRRLTPDLSVSGALRAEHVSVFDPRVLGVPELDAALGDSELYSGRVSIIHDTRDLPFMPTEGHLIELSYEQVFGTFDYPRGEVDYSQYFLLRERPDGSGRHTLAFSTKLGFSGADTPIFENYFAGGFSTMRGYSFRGASPIDSGVRVGGEFRWLNSVEYFFPLTADDMIKGVVFCDFGTVEEKIELESDNFRVAPGFGFRVNVPALGPAPLAFDFAFPVASAERDDEQMFSFFFGAMR